MSLLTNKFNNNNNNMVYTVDPIYRGPRDILCPCIKIGGGHKNIYLDIPPTLCYRSYLYFLELHLECSEPANIKRARLPQQP